MKKLVGALVVASFTLAVACSPDESTPPPPHSNDTVLADGVVVADDGFSGDARVSADHVDIVTQGHEAGLANIHPGSILVSRRSFTHPDLNPYGFIRRVVSVSTNGGDTVITTTRATLADAIVHGSFDVIPTREQDTDPALSTRTLRPLDEPPPPPDGITFPLSDVSILDSSAQASQGSTVESGSLTLKLVGNAVTLGARPELAGSFDAGRFRALHTALTVKYDATSKLTVEGNGQVTANVQKTIVEKAIGNYFFLIGVVPVEVTVKVKIGVACTASVSGKIGASASWHAYGNAKTGVDYVDGEFTSLGTPTDFTLDGEPAVTSETNASAHCEMPVELHVYLYDLAGPFAAFVPSARVSTTSSKCTPPKIGIAIDVGSELRLGVDGEVLGRTAGWSWSKPTPDIHLWPKAGAAAETCPADTMSSGCTSDTGCGAGKACSWNGMTRCCRTPAAADAKKCLADTDCGSGEVCGWNLQYFVCQAPACN